MLNFLFAFVIELLFLLYAIFLFFLMDTYELYLLRDC